MPKQQTNIRLDKESKKLLEQASRETGMNMGQIVSMILRWFLKPFLDKWRSG